MRREGIANNPILIGTGAILVVLVTILLSYNANSGLPFVPTYNVNAQLHGGANLVVGNDVRIGGARVGLVSKITPERRRDGTVYAEIEMKLDKQIEPIPVDSWTEVRPRSTIGLKYVQLTLGHSKVGLPPGGTLTKNKTGSEFDDLLNTMKPKVRNNWRRVLDEFGDGLAGRGVDFNAAFGTLYPLLQNLEVFSKTFAAPATGFERFLRAISQAAGDYAPVAQQGAQVFINADITFTALANATQGIQDTISASPGALETFTTEFPKQRPYFDKLTALVTAFDGGAKYIPSVSSDMATITTTGQSALNHLARTSPAIATNFQALADFAANPMVELGLRNLVTFNQVINQPLAFIAPSQTVCNYPGLLVRNLASALFDRGTDSSGGYVSWLRFAALIGAIGPNSQMTPSAAPAQISTPPVPGLAAQWDYLQSNPYPYTAAPGQHNICAAGNEYTKGSLTKSEDFGFGPGLPNTVRFGNPPGIPSAGNRHGITRQDTSPVDTGALQK